VALGYFFTACSTVTTDLIVLADFLGCSFASSATTTASLSTSAQQTMFGFRSIVAILAAATTFTSALPATPADGASVAKRVADASPMGADVFARAPEAVVVRGDAPQTIPDCISKYHDTVDPILVEIQAQIDINADVQVFVSLYAQIVVAIQQLTVDILALVDVSVDIFAGLTLSAVATLFVDVFVDLTAKIQATVKIFAVVDLSVYLNVYLQIVAAFVACVQAIIKIAVGINVFLDVQLVAVINVFVSLCLTLGASLDVIATLQALILLL